MAEIQTFHGESNSFSWANIHFPSALILHWVTGGGSQSQLPRGDDEKHREQVCGLLQNRHRQTSFTLTLAPTCCWGIKFLSVIRRPTNILVGGDNDTALNTLVGFRHACPRRPGSLPSAPSWGSVASGVGREFTERWWNKKKNKLHDKCHRKTCTPSRWQMPCFLPAWHQLPLTKLLINGSTAERFNTNNLRRGILPPVGQRNQKYFRSPVCHMGKGQRSN